MGALVTLFLAVYPDVIRGWINKFAPALLHVFDFLRPFWIPGALFFGGCIAIWIRHYGQEKEQIIEGLQEQINVLTKATEKIPNRRWETIKNIKYGHIGYDPFLRYEHGKIKPTGFGVDLLNKLLGAAELVTVKPEDDERSWDRMAERFAPGVCDVLATPMFATFDRSSKVRFTAPLFFSNVGLYVNIDATPAIFWQGMTVDNLKERLKDSQFGDPQFLKFISFRGEISEKLAKKYAQGQVDTRAGHFLPGTLLKDVADSVFPPRALFCESYVAEDQLEKLKVDWRDAVPPPTRAFPRVINVLPANSILYPVCFAVPYGDYQLANLLNIRLLQLTRQESALDQMAEWLANDRRLMDGEKPEEKFRTKFIEKVKTHFVAEWPSMEEKDGTHA